MDAIYVRQSVYKKDSLSIEGQIELCKRYADKDAKIYCDRGYSAKSIKRPALSKLITDIEAGEIDKLYIYRLDRLSRSLLNFSQLWSLMERNGVNLESITENFDTSTPMGRAMLNIVMTFAQLERETTAERVRDNYYYRFGNGSWPGGPAPYGFCLAKITDKKGNLVSSLRENKEQSKVVVKIFEAYVEKGLSLRGIATMLSDENIHGPKREKWDNVTLSRILHNPAYVRADADVYWHYMSLGFDIHSNKEDFDGVHACNCAVKRLVVSNHEGFIDSKLWLKAQQKLSKNKQISNQNQGKHSWLTGLLKCAQCGYSVKINNTRGRLYMLCSGRSNLKICEASIAVNIRELEECVGKKLKETIGECLCENMDFIDKDKVEKLLNIEQKIERLIGALSQSGSVSATYISEEIERLHNEREALSLVGEKRQRADKIDFEKLSFGEKKLIASLFIDKILLKDDSAEILWKI